MPRRGRKPICPYCRSKQTIAKGHRPTVTLGKRRLRFCNACQRKFTVGKASAVRKPAAKPQVPTPQPAAPAGEAIVHESALGPMS